jgi:hypothetical protein
VRDIFNDKIREYEKKINEFNALKKKLEDKLQRWITPESARSLKFTICPQITAEKQ